ncbi:phage terminase small subunit [Halomonas sp. M20]|uniref:phage terminase small subunit n=1 Tax=Halomonas sp. M20 TaxID=2763264 RepID=UPI001D0BC320|nr:phage terminase small subunit [Halomonas sp. M20]
MTSPARRHYQRITAAKAAGDAQSGQPQTGEQYELHAAALWEARRTLKNIKSVAAKIDKKRELLPEFDSYVAGVIEAGNGAQDDVLMTIMVWRIDTGDIEGALAIAEYALHNGLDTPDRYERDTASLVTEQIAEEALSEIESDDAQAYRLAPLLEHLNTLTADMDMHDPIRAKLHKALGYALRESGAGERALDHLKQALSLNERIGVKKDIEKLERFIKQQNERDQG